MNREERAELAVWARPLTIYSVTQKRLILNHAQNPEEQPNVPGQDFVNSLEY